MTDDHTDESERFGVTRRAALGATGALLGGLTLGGTALAQQSGSSDGQGQTGGARRYRVTVTNLTSGQPFTPPAVALHRPSVELFSVGEPANEAIQQVAENGNLGPLLDLANSTDAVRGAGVFTTGGSPTPLVPEADPGDTGLPYFGTVEVSADASATHLSLVSMLIATNDGFVGLDTVALPEAVNESHTHFAASYDAGTEENTELFRDMVPPAQALIQGEVTVEGTAESEPGIATDGVITPHPGIEGGANLDAAVYDWSDPAATVQVERID
ncbi:MAG: spondin domain-containing protein [Haloferacaceae archaeon]